MGPIPTATRAELEYNALAVTWDLFMVRPYRNGGPALNSFETVQPSESTYTGPKSGGRCCDCLAYCRLSRGAAGRGRHWREAQETQQRGRAALRQAPASSAPPPPAGWMPAKRATWVGGAINNASLTSSGWTIEIALPWAILGQAAKRASPPKPGRRRCSSSTPLGTRLLSWQVPALLSPPSAWAGEP